MGGISRMIGVFLLGVMVATLPDAQTFALTAASPAHAAGCHEHGGAPAAPEPVRYPVNYQCCANGHHAAVPATTFVPDDLAVQNCHLTDGLFLSSSRLVDSAIPVDPSHSPPDISPLRI
jgi:hypothetical protein